MSGEEGVRPSIVAVVWEGEAPSIRRIKGRLGCDLELYTQTYMDSHGMSPSSLVERMRRAKVTLLHSLSKELFESLLPELEPYLQECRVISHGTASSVLISNVRPEVSAKAAEYLAVKGDENMFRLFDFLEKEFAGKPGDPLPCVSVPKDSLVSPEDGSLVADVDDYMRSFVPEGASRAVAVVGSSSAYDEDRMASERELCRALMDEGVYPILFYIGYGSGPEGKAIDLCEAVRKYCFCDGSPIIGAIVKPSRCSL
ncbi:MAG: cobaltochelatase subunit CobN [Candidatus Methanomethylophilaceae archaeon]|nr:cobaltochelatase subunit CobN [Candidatus Methanomethylophilaceae archaeon]